ncbi:MAG: hypothetical protein U0836_13055 [Pirellulales bacterium]
MTLALLNSAASHCPGAPISSRSAVPYAQPVRAIVPQNIKRAVLEMIERMPEEATLEEIAAEIFFRQQVDEGLRQLDAGEGIPHEEVVQRLGKWLPASRSPAR